MLKEAPTQAVAITGRRTYALVAALLATFMTALDNNIVNVAIPTMQRSLHLSQTGIEWVVSAYILFFAGLLLAGGRLADVLGRRRIFAIGLVTFTSASLMAGLAGSETTLILARALQGIGAALLVPTTLSIVTHAYRDPREQARAVGLWGAVSALALAIGPVVGGLLTEHVSWSWIFFLNVPIGALTLAFGLYAVPSERFLGRRGLDGAGIATSSTSLFALTYALIQGNHDGWSSPVIVASFALSALAALVFVAIELSVDDPMVDLRIFSNRNFSVGTAVLTAWAFGLFGIYFFTAIYLQEVLGFSATKAGLAFVPMALMMGIGATISDRVALRAGPNRLIGASMFAMAAGIASVSLLGAHVGILALMPGFVIIGLGGGFTIPLASIVVGTMPVERSGVASGIFNVSREVAGLLGITIIGVVLSARQGAALRAGSNQTAAFLTGYRAGLLVAAGVVGLAGVIALVGLPRRARVESTSHFSTSHESFDLALTEMARASMITASA